jgi:hypothetical protein
MVVMLTLDAPPTVVLVHGAYHLWLTDLAFTNLQFCTIVTAAVVERSCAACKRVTSPCVVIFRVLTLNFVFIRSCRQWIWMQFSKLRTIFIIIALL